MNNYQYEYEYINVLEVNGKDAKKFLQKLTTADLDKLSPKNDTIYTVFSNLKGRIISLCFIKYHSDNKLLISINSDITDNFIFWLKKYEMFSEVDFFINSEYSLFYTEKGFLNHDILFVNSFKSNINFAEIQKQNILYKLAFINSYNFEKFLPAELELDNIENVICYTKGCYMGQEIIAKMHYRSKLKKELLVVQSTSNILELDLKDNYNKPLASVVNRVFVKNVCYLLVIFHKKTTEVQYELEGGEVIVLCRNNPSDSISKIIISLDDI